MSFISDAPPSPYRGEETDLGASRTLTRLPYVSRNTVGRGQRGPRFYLISFIVRICRQCSLSQRDGACPHVVRVVLLSF